MDSRFRPHVFLFLAIFLAPILLLGTASASPAESETFRPGSRAVSLAGRVVSGGAPVANALVTERSTGQTARTDSHGRFLISDLPTERTTLSVTTGSGMFVTRFLASSKGGGRSRGIISIGGAGIPGGSAVIFLPISGHGHEGEEIEGAVTANDGTSLTVHDDRLGDVIVTPTPDAVIRHGGTTLTLADILVGWTVHAKAALQVDGTYLAGEIIVQDMGGDTGGDDTGDDDSEVSGTVSAFDCVAGTMVLSTDGGDVNVTFGPDTVFKMKGQIVTCDGLAVGDEAEVEGALQGDGSVLASKVSFEAPEAEDVEVEGVVKSVSDPTFVVTTESGDVTVATNGSTQFFKHPHSPAAFSDVVVGAEVKATGALQADSSVLAAKVTIE